MTGLNRICGGFLDFARNDIGARAFPLFGRDCRVARRAPRNDPVFISLQL
ncbi:MAG: hypothetical protein LBL66_06850 [Clostridiales bacterium]|nr:hypothetical protein [Clostridiales bacterium]